MEEKLLAAVEEMRDLLRLIAAPHIAERDKKKRAELRRIVGSSQKAQAAVLMMDGTRKQRDIADAVPIHKGQLSVLVKELTEADLCEAMESGPKIKILIDEGVFFEEGEGVKK